MADPRDALIAELKEKLRVLEADLRDLRAAFCRAMAARDAHITELEEKLRVSEAELRAAPVRRWLREALAQALWETRAYHRSILTGRCGVAAAR
jgi:hypothetical protein